MQIVINISEKIYESVMNGTYCGTLYQELKNGTPLPKGHEKLIAEPTEKDIAKTVGGQNDFAECIRDAVKAVFDNAQTIIEADKTGK